MGFTNTGLAATRFHFQGMQAEVQVSRDKNGIPYIYAHNDHDAYYMMGYIEASDRFFQMDCARRYYQGTSAELFGKSALGTDRQIRQSGLPYYALESAKALPPEIRELLQAFSDGVNQYLKNNALPTAYKTLHLTKKNIPDWKVEDSLVIARGINANVSSLTLVAGPSTSPVLTLDDVARTESFLRYVQAGKQHGFNGTALWFQDIYRAVPNGVAVTIPNFFKKQIPLNNKNDVISASLQKISDVPSVRQPNQSNDDGSNIFAIDGKHTVSGYPILANDSHYSLRSPPLWYLINVSVDDPKKPMDAHLSVLVPGSFIYKSGNNNKIAWGSTTSRVDVTDVFLEHLRLNKNGIPTQVLSKKNFYPLKEIKQTYYYNTFTTDVMAIADRHPLQDDIFLIPYLNEGPLLNISGDVGYGVQSTIFGKINSRDLQGYFSLPRSKNLNDFKKGIQLLDTSYYNFGYIDNQGNIAFFESGAIPLRKDLENQKITGNAPFFVRDSTIVDQNAWIFLEKIPDSQSLPYKIMPFDEMPHIINPAQGFFVNSNNDPVGLTLNNNALDNNYRSNGGIYFIAFKFATGERAEQMTNLINSKLLHKHKISLDDVKEIQTNNQSFLAKRLVPYILGAFADAQSAEAPAQLKIYTQNSAIIEAIDRLRQWDYTTPTGIKEGYNSGKNAMGNSIATTLYYVWQGRFLKNTIEKTLLENGLPSESYQIDTTAILNLLDTFKKNHGIGASGLNFFKVSHISNADFARDYIILKSLQEALDLLKSPSFSSAFQLSPKQDDYYWGKLHRVIFTNPINNNIPVLGGFNNLTSQLPGISRDGGIETINPGNFNGLARSPEDFLFTSGASLRRIIEMQPNQVISYFSLPGGENEEASSPYFSNLLNDWLTGQYQREN